MPTHRSREVALDFRLTFASAPSGITVGSVLASDVTKALPNGLLVKVTKVDGGTVLATEAALGDALEQGEFLVEKQFTAADIRGMALAPGVTATGRDRARGRKGRRRRLSGADARSRVGDSSATGG